VGGGGRSWRRGGGENETGRGWIGTGTAAATASTERRWGGAVLRRAA
jgi:hypothetical protein